MTWDSDPLQNENPKSSFYVILFTNKQTKNNNHLISLAEVTIICSNCKTFCIKTLAF